MPFRSPVAADEDVGAKMGRRIGNARLDGGGGGRCVHKKLRWMGRSGVVHHVASDTPSFQGAWVPGHPRLDVRGKVVAHARPGPTRCRNSPA